MLGSGANYAAFALAGLGAQVASVDISQAQLDVAKSRAGVLRLPNVAFRRADVTDLPKGWASTFDLACSTNGIAVWLEDMGRYYREAHRILGPGGVLVTYDVHPSQRPWAESVDLRVVRPYFDSAPKAERDGPAEPAGRDSRLTYQAHWTMGELITGLIYSSLILVHLQEEPANAAFWQATSYVISEDNASLGDWRANPWAGLPAWLTLVARRRAHEMPRG